MEPSVWFVSALTLITMMQQMSDHMYVFCYSPRVRFLLGGRHGDFKFVPPPGYAPCYEAVLPKDKLRIEPIKEYKNDLDNDVRNLLGPTQSLSHTAFTPNPVDTVQVQLILSSLI